MVVVGWGVKEIDVAGERSVGSTIIGVSTWWGDNRMRGQQNEGTMWWGENMMSEQNYKETIRWRNHMIEGLKNKRTRLHDKGITFWEI